MTEYVEPKVEQVWLPLLLFLGVPSLAMSGFIALDEQKPLEFRLGFGILIAALTTPLALWGALMLLRGWLGKRWFKKRSKEIDRSKLREDDDEDE